MTSPRVETILGRRPVFWAGALVLTTLALRLWFVASGQLNLVQDEAQYWDWSRTLQLSYYSKGPLIALIIRLWTGCFGGTELGVRFGAVVGASLAQVLLYWGVAVLWGRPRTALWALVMAATMPLFAASGVLMTTDNPLLLCWLGALFSLHLAGTGRGGAWPFVSLAACLALGILAKYIMLTFVVTALWYSLWLSRQGTLPQGYWFRLCLCLGLGTALGALPILVWNFQNDWAGILHVVYRGALAGSKAKDLLRPEKTVEYLAGQVGVLTPWWSVFVIGGAWAALGCFLGRPHRTVDLDEGPMVLLGAGFWPVWVGYGLLSLHTGVEANWPGVSYVAGLILAAAAWSSFWDRSRSVWARWKIVWPVLGTAVILAIIFQNVLPVPERINLALRLKGWEDLGRRAAQVKTESFVDPSRVFVFSDSYDMTAALSFYVPGQSRAYCLDTGRRLNQYDFWPGPDDKMGWDALLVLKNAGRSLHPRVQALFDRVDERMDYQTLHRGQPARTFTVYRCYGYRGPWPKARARAF